LDVVAKDFAVKTRRLSRNEKAKREYLKEFDHRFDEEVKRLNCYEKPVHSPLFFPKTVQYVLSSNLDILA
jgi:hypothetical protein